MKGDKVANEVAAASKQAGEHMKVYISYEPTTVDLAQKIIEFYTGQGFEVLHLTPVERDGPDRDRLSEELIKCADLAVCFVSRQSLASAQQRFEAGAVKRLKKAIVPIVVGDVADAELPSEFIAYRTLRVGSSDNVGTLLTELKEMQSLLPNSSTAITSREQQSIAQPRLTQDQQIVALALVNRVSSGSPSDGSTLDALSGDSGHSALRETLNQYDEQQLWAARRQVERKVSHFVAHLASPGSSLDRRLMADGASHQTPDAGASLELF